MFEKLVFQQHPVQPDAKLARYFFPNGYGVSVVGGGFGLYGNGETTFEVAILKGTKDNWNLTYTTNITDDVLGYQDIEEVSEIMRKVSELK